MTFDNAIKMSSDNAAEITKFSNLIVELVSDITSIENSGAKNESNVKLLKSKISIQILSNKKYTNDKQRTAAISELLLNNDEYKQLSDEAESIKSAKILKNAEIDKLKITKKLYERLYEISVLKCKWFIALENKGE